MKYTFLILGTILNGICAWYWLYPYHFALPYFETDFVDYCIGVTQWDDYSRHFPPKRSRLAGVIPGIWYDTVGVLNSLAIASASAMLAVGCLLVCWAERLREHAGWYTLAALMACSPWVGMGRLLNFYPEILLGLSIGSYWVWWSIQKDNIHTQWLRGSMMGVGIGLCALIDARGLIWSGWFCCVALGWLFYRSTWRQSLQRLIGLMTTLGLTWYLGQWVYDASATSLIRQLDVRPLRYALSLEGAPAPPYTLPTEFIWGREWHGIWENLIFLFSQQQSGLPTGIPSTYWIGWLSILGLSLMSTIRSHWIFWVLSVPFLIAYLQIGYAVEDHVRFYTQSLPPLLIGIGLALSRLTASWPQRFQQLSMVVCLLLLPYLSLMVGHHWTIEREISHKMLQQAHPNHSTLRAQDTLFGTPIHIQTLPVTTKERQITQDWDMVCTEALSQHPPLLWFEKP